MRRGPVIVGPAAQGAGKLAGVVAVPASTFSCVPAAIDRSLSETLRLDVVGEGRMPVRRQTEICRTERARAVLRIEPEAFAAALDHGEIKPPSPCRVRRAV